MLPLSGLDFGRVSSTKTRKVNSIKCTSKEVIYKFSEKNVQYLSNSSQHQTPKLSSFNDFPVEKL